MAALSSFVVSGGVEVELKEKNPPVVTDSPAVSLPDPVQALPAPTHQASATPARAGRMFAPARQPVAKKHESPMSSMSTDELLSEFRHRSSQAAFEEVVRRYGGMVISTCQNVVKNRHDAEDAAQATFLTLARQLQMGKEIHAVGPWLQQVAHRVALDQRKSSKRRTRRENIHGSRWHELGQENQERFQETLIDLQDVRRVLSEELDKLPPKYRLPLILHFYGGLSREQMSKELSCKPATLGVRIFRAKEMLGKQLAKRGILIEGVIGVGAGTSAASASAAVLPASSATVLGASLFDSLMRDVTTGGISAGMIRNTAEIAVCFGGAVQTGFAHAHGLISPLTLQLTEQAAWNLGLGGTLGRLKVAIAAALLTGSAVATGGHLSGHFPITLPSLRDSTDALFNQIKQWLMPMPGDLIGGLRLSKAESETLPYSNTLIPALPASDAGQLLSVNDLGGIDARGEKFSALEFTSVRHGETSVVVMQPGRSHLQQGGRDDVSTRALQASVTGGVHVSGLASSTTTDTPRLHISANSDTQDEQMSLSEPSALAFSGEVVSGSSGKVFKLASDSLAIRPVGVSATHRGNKAVGPALSHSPASASASSGKQMADAGWVAVPVADTPSTAVLTSTTADGVTTVHGLVGHGKPNISNVLDNSGVVIADGGGETRTLDLTAARVTNTIDNPADEAAGWYARNGGRLALATQRQDYSESSFVWGEDPSDRSLDLVNSLRLSLAGGAQTELLNVQLLPNDSDGALNVPGMALSVYQVEMDDVDVRRLSFSARYDDLLLSELTSELADTLVPSGRPNLAVWTLIGVTWKRQSQIWIDGLGKTLSGTLWLSDEPISLLAISLDVPKATDQQVLQVSGSSWMLSDLPQHQMLASSRLWTHGVISAGFTADSSSVSALGSVPAVFVPEPSSGLLVVALGGLLLGRRRRSSGLAG